MHTMATDLSILPPRRQSSATTGPAKVREAAAAVQKGSAVMMPPPRQLQRLPPIGGGGGAKADDKMNKGATAMAGAEPATKAWMRRVLAKRVAKRMRMLKRSTAPPPLEDPGVLLREAHAGHALRAAPSRRAGPRLDATRAAAQRLR